MCQRYAIRLQTAVRGPDTQTRCEKCLPDVADAALLCSISEVKVVSHDWLHWGGPHFTTRHWPTSTKARREEKEA